jgi:hypothetical protein
MESILLLALVPAIILVVILFRVIAGSMDHARLRDYVESRGGEIIDSSWAPFGPGWFGGNRERIYLVRYFDRDRNEHEAYAKTNMWSGVYFTEDRVVHHARRLDEKEVESLEDENARLRAELERLKRKERDQNSDAIQE